jgi:hypothetical protein
MFEASLNTGERFVSTLWLTYPVKFVFFIGFCIFGLEFVIKGYKHYLNSKITTKGENHG